MQRHHLQGPELWHVVETGHRQSADVVIVEGAKKRKSRMFNIYLCISFKWVYFGLQHTEDNQQCRGGMESWVYITSVHNLF